MTPLQPCAQCGNANYPYPPIVGVRPAVRLALDYSAENVDSVEGAVGSLQSKSALIRRYRVLSNGTIAQPKDAKIEPALVLVHAVPERRCQKAYIFRRPICTFLCEATNSSDRAAPAENGLNL